MNVTCVKRPEHRLAFWVFGRRISTWRHTSVWTVSSHVQDIATKSEEPKVCILIQLHNGARITTDMHAPCHLTTRRCRTSQSLKMCRGFRWLRCRWTLAGTRLLSNRSVLCRQCCHLEDRRFALSWSFPQWDIDLSSTLNHLLLDHAKRKLTVWPSFHLAHPAGRTKS